MALLDWLRCPFCNESLYGITSNGEGVGETTAIGLWADCRHTPVNTAVEELHKLDPATRCPACGEQGTLSHAVERAADARVEQAIEVSCPAGHSTRLVLATKEENPLDVEWGGERNQRLVTDEW